MTTSVVTPVAVLGTIAAFHCEPIRYNLAALVQLVRDVQPDLLCLDMVPEQWERRDFAPLPPEYRQALLPLAEQSDIVVVPIGMAQTHGKPALRGWRRDAVEGLRAAIATLQRSAPSAAVVNSGVRHLLADWCYSSINMLYGSGALQAERQHIQHFVAQVRMLATRDVGRRILIVVNVQHCHHLRNALRRVPELRLVSYDQL